MLQELIEFCGESTDFLWMSRWEQVTFHTIISGKSKGRAFIILRFGVNMKNRPSDDYAKDGVPGQPELYVVLTTNVC